MARNSNNGYIGAQANPGRGTLNSNYLQSRNADILAMDTFIDGFDTSQNITTKAMNGTYSAGSVYYATDKNQLNVIGPHGEKHVYTLF